MPPAPAFTLPMGLLPRGPRRDTVTVLPGRTSSITRAKGLRLGVRTSGAVLGDVDEEISTRRIWVGLLGEVVGAMPDAADADADVAGI